jgi:hypothetical protein
VLEASGRNLALKLSEFVASRSDGVVTLAAYLVALAAIGIGVGGAVSVAWALVVVGGIVMGTVFCSRMGGRKK